MSSHISILDLFTIGIGPSSSHTVGPMRAANHFLDDLAASALLPQVARVECHLFGSLALTGKGHGTDKALILGLEGATPEGVDVDAVPARLAAIRSSQVLRLAGEKNIAFNESSDILFHRRQTLTGHSNGMRLDAFDATSSLLQSKTYYSVGGGFIIEQGQEAGKPVLAAQQVPFPYTCGDDLLRMARESGMSVSEMTLRNESYWRPEAQTRERLLKVWHAMKACVVRGCESEGTLPGGFRIVRRAPGLSQKLRSHAHDDVFDPLATLDWVSLWAMAVNEENAAGGRVVTAPTNGAAGIIPAVLHYYVHTRGENEDGIVRFLLTAGAIGLLYKRNASISGAEVGCQGEVGVACSMSAGALTEVLGGTASQVENAAEIGMEHNLGLTCDPIGGLVQVPCIERNAMGAVKAINASRLALQGDGTHHVSLDKVIRTMRQTGADMSTKYKETSRGGLAVNIPEC